MDALVTGVCVASPEPLESADGDGVEVGVTLTEPSLPEKELAGLTVACADVDSRPLADCVAQTVAVAELLRRALDKPLRDGTREGVAGAVLEAATLELALGLGPLLALPAAVALPEKGAEALAPLEPLSELDAHAVALLAPLIEPAALKVADGVPAAECDAVALAHTVELLLGQLDSDGLSELAAVRDADTLPVIAALELPVADPVYGVLPLDTGEAVGKTDAEMLDVAQDERVAEGDKLPVLLRDAREETLAAVLADEHPVTLKDPEPLAESLELRESDGAEVGVARLLREPAAVCDGGKRETVALPDEQLLCVAEVITDSVPVAHALSVMEGLAVLRAEPLAVAELHAVTVELVQAVKDGAELTVAQGEGEDDCDTDVALLTDALLVAVLDRETRLLDDAAPLAELCKEAVETGEPVAPDDALLDTVTERPLDEDNVGAAVAVTLPHALALARVERVPLRVGEALGELHGETEKATLGDGDTDTDGVDDGQGDALRLARGVALAEVDADVDSVADADREVLCVALGLSVADGVALSVALVRAVAQALGVAVADEDTVAHNEGLFVEVALRERGGVRVAQLLPVATGEGVLETVATTVAEPEAVARPGEGVAHAVALPVGEPVRPELLLGAGPDGDALLQLLLLTE